MRLLIVSQYFPPEIGAPQARLSETAELLIDLHWEVGVLTALPNYPSGRVFAEYCPATPTSERIGRIRTVRVPLRPANNGFVKRLCCYFSFVAAANRYGPRLCQPPDLLFVESPPLFIGYTARYLSRHWQCPYVFNVSDLWPESAIRIGVVKKGLLTAMAERLELSFYREAAGVTGQSCEIIDSIRRRSPGTRTQVITNGVDLTRFGRRAPDDSAREVLGSEPGPVFLYAGLLGLAQGLDQILDLAKTLPDDVPGRFVLIGDGPMRKKLAVRIASERIFRVRLVPPVSRDRIPALLATADAAIITLGMTIPGAVPSKIYEAMASALPILLVAEGEAAKRVRSAQCGLTAAPGDLEALREAWCLLASDPEMRRQMGEQGRKAAESQYSRAALATRLDAFLRSCLRRKPFISPPLDNSAENVAASIARVA